MPNLIDANGLQTKTQAELVAEFTAAMQAIYGPDINLDQSTPDGQMMLIFIQATLDNLDLLTQIYNQFDPDNAIGKVLDQRVAFNGIQRQSGTYTVTNITITTDRALTLTGLDLSPDDPYTVSDNAGNEWQLVTTQNPSGAGSYVYVFSSAIDGAVLTTPNTITVPVSVVLGVTTINNPTVYTTLGINEESDADLKIRRAKSVSLASQGYLAGLLASLENITGMNSAFVYENNTGTTDSDGVPGHSLWVIVSGTAAAVDIATSIYKKRNAGCGMKGANSYTITQVDGSPFIVLWDDVIQENLFILFTAESIDDVNLPNISSIRPDLIDYFIPGVNEEVNINNLATKVQIIDSNTLVTGAGFTTARTQTLNFDDVAASGVFKVNYNGDQSVDINWNDGIGVIEAAIQAITGLANVNVTGTIGGQQLIVDLDLVPTVNGLLTITDNTLQNGGAVDIAITLELITGTTLEPTTKQLQFSLLEENIIITDIQLLPATSVVLSLGNLQFSSYGGYGGYFYEISVDNSGASIDQNGLYTAGGSAGIDTVKITDDLGNFITSAITVV